MKVLIVDAFLLVSSVAWAAPTLTVNGSSGPITVSGGTTVTLVVHNGPANQWDCVSLNASPDVNAAWLNYAFLAPFSKTGTVTFTVPSAAGTYGVLFWQNCNTWIMTGPSVTVAAGAITTTLGVNGSNAPVTVPGGTAVTVSIQNGPGNQWDCVSLNAAGSPASAWLNYAWVNGRNAVLSFSIPSTAGVVYEFRFWQNCNTWLATSPTVATALSIGSPSVPSANQLPELPRAYVDTTMPTTTANVTVCGSGCNLQAALDAANLGDIIELQAGASYPGRIELPNKTYGTGWIIIRSSAWASLPPPGTRVGPQHAPLMAKITTNSSALYDMAVLTREGAHHYRFIGIEVTGADPAPHQQNTLFLIDGSHYDASGVWQQQPTYALTPHHIVLDRCYIHGTPTGEFIHGVLMNGQHIGIIDSYLSNFHSRNSDTQAAVAWDTPGPLKLANNYLESAGENIMFGGAASGSAGYVPSDIEIRHNLFDKPLSWRPGDPAYAGIAWIVKNLLEFKDGQRALIEGNIFAHHWAGAQSGWFFVITPRSEYNQNPWAFTGDITFRYNKILKTTAGPTFSGTDLQVTQNSTRVLFEHNVFENIGAYVVPGAFSGEFSMSGNAMQNFTFRHNTIFQSYTAFHFAGDDLGPMNGFTVVDNIFSNAGYPFVGDTTLGIVELNMIAPGSVIRKNAIYGPMPNANGITQAFYPAENYFPASQDAVGFVNLAGGDYHLAASSPYKNAGTDGTDVGADIDAVNSATGCAISGICGTP